MFCFMQMHAPSLAVCLKMRLISFVKATKNPKKRQPACLSSLFSFTYASLSQQICTSCRLQHCELEVIISHSSAKRYKTDAIIYRHYSLPPQIAPMESPPAHEIHPPINLPSDHLLRPDLARSPWGDAWGLEAIFLLMELQGKPDLMILPCKQGWQFKSDLSVSVSRPKTSLQGIDLFILSPSGEKKRGCGQG